MALDPKILGRKLKESRENRGLSQEDVAERLNIPRTAITHIEAGNRSVSTLELTQFAELYQRPVAAFLSDVPLPDEDPLFALHRVEDAFAKNPAVQEELSQCLSICRDGYELEKLLGHGERFGPPAYKLAIPQSTGEAVRQAAEIADMERRRLQLGHSPIADMAELICSEGIWASGARLPDPMSGMFLRHPSVGLAILVNFTHARSRKRFSYAHEYGHALMDRDLSVTVSSQGNAADLVEKRANAFAAAFLMPKDGVASLLRSMNKGQPSRIEEKVYDVANAKAFDAHARPAPGSQFITYQDVAMLASHFGVSYHAATYRLMSLRLVTKPEGEDLLSKVDYGNQYLSVVDLFDDLEKPEEGGRQDRELVALVVHLAAEAYRREEISKGRLLDISKKLNISGRKLLELADACG